MSEYMAVLASWSKLSTLWTLYKNESGVTNQAALTTHLLSVTLCTYLSWHIEDEKIRQTSVFYIQKIIANILPFKIYNRIKSVTWNWLIDSNPDSTLFSYVILAKLLHFFLLQFSQVQKGKQVALSLDCCES